MTEIYWIVTKKWTVRVVINENFRIVDGAPLIRRFIGQPMTNLINWAKRCGLVAIEG